MRFQHSATGPFTRACSLARPDGSTWTFLLRPLPLGFHRRLRERGLVPPAPPIRVPRDSAGKPLRDDAGLPLATADTSDPDYRAALELYHQRVAVLALHEGLQADPSVQFDAPAPSSALSTLNPQLSTPNDWASFADALYAELAAAGFTDGDLVTLCNEVGRLSNLVGDHVQQARSNFSSPPALSTA